MARQHKKIVPESELKAEYIQKLVEVQKEPTVRVGSPRDLRKRYGLK